MKVCSIEICLHGYYILPSAPRLAGLRYTRYAAEWVGLDWVIKMRTQPNGFWVGLGYRWVTQEKKGTDIWTPHPLPRHTLSGYLDTPLPAI